MARRTIDEKPCRRFKCDTIPTKHETLYRMRVVIKVGTSLIAPGGQIDANLLRAMVDQFDLSRTNI